MCVEVAELSFSYGKEQILKNISFHVGQGEIFAVMGQNGAGKSTLLRCILGLLPSYQGRIMLQGTNIKDLKPSRIATMAAYIPQKSTVTFGYTVEEMVLMGSSVAGNSFRIPGEQEQRRAGNALEKLGMESLAKRSFPTLSGGEQQLVLIARALAQQARLLIMDEPTASLDFGNQAKLFALLRKLTLEGFTIILSLHNPQQVLSYTDRVLVLQKGKTLAVGVSGQVVTAELLQELYHMEASVTDTPFGTAVFLKNCE